MRTLLWSSVTFLCLNTSNVMAESIVNGDFESGNTGFTESSNYIYQSSGMSSPGIFGIIKNPATNYTNGDTSYGDHTTGHGNMLFVDASPIANSAFWSETIDVAANTSFTFSGWATAADPTNPAVIRLLVNGSAVGADFTLNGGKSGIFQQFSDSFNTGPATSSITLSLVDQNLAGDGNDFTVDDLSLTANGLVVPEPASLVLASLGLLGVAGWGWVSRSRVGRCH